MSNTARKARKRLNNAARRLGIEESIVTHVRSPRVATPLRETAWWNAQFPGVPGTRFASQLMPRSAAKRQKALDSRDPKKLQAIVDRRSAK